MTEPEQYSKLKVAAHVHIRKVHGEASLLDLRTGNCFGLNSLGRVIWERIAEHGDVGLVIRELLGEFEVDEATLSGDVCNLVDALLARGLLVPSEPASK